MASQSSLSAEARNAGLGAVCSLHDAGYIRFYGGEQPTSCDTPMATDCKLLGEVRYGTPAFRLTGPGKYIANQSEKLGAAVGEGVATWFRVFKADGKSPVRDGSVGTKDANIVLKSVTMSPGLDIEILSDVLLWP